MYQEHGSILLSGGLGRSDKLKLEHGSRVQAWSPRKMFKTTLLDCNKSLLNIKIHSILDRISFLLYHINTSKKVGGGAAAP